MLRLYEPQKGEIYVNGKNINDLNVYDFSGGQKQRLMIAKVLLKNPNTVLLDEATSALDILLEEQIIKEFTEVGNNNRTIIIISHRLNTIKNCNKIMVLNEG